MKYFWNPWSSSKRHQIMIENKTPMTTKAIKGYGIGVTISATCKRWKQDYTSTPTIISFADSDVSTS